MENEEKILEMLGFILSQFRHLNATIMTKDDLRNFRDETDDRVGEPSTALIEEDVARIENMAVIKDDLLVSMQET